MAKKSEFHLEDFNFKVVRLDVFSTYYEEITNKISYYLLVDEDDLIHDYKVFFNKISITPFTTGSHLGDSKDRNILRMELLNILKLKHVFQVEKGKRKEYWDFNFEDIKKNKINEWSFKKNWSKITFQNVWYILSGCNPKGEGNGLSNLKTMYKNDVYPFGFLLKALNISEHIDQNYDNVNYNEIWDLYKNNNFSNCIDFENWIEFIGLEKFLKLFKLDSFNWKIHKSNLEKHLMEKTLKFKQIDEIIRKKYRYDFVKNIKDFYSKIKKDMLVDFLYYKYFNIKNKSITNYEKAHIKPVWLIKKEYMKNNDKKILGQISDLGNFLPLSKNIHWLYDHQYLYWDINGKLIELKDVKEKDEIKKFLQISEIELEKMKFYLKEYYQKIVKIYLIKN